MQKIEEIANDRLIKKYRSVLLAVSYNYLNEISDRALNKFSAA